MLTAIQNLLEKTNNIKRASYTWNGLNALISAVESPIIIMVMTRTTGSVDDVGIFSIAYTLGALLLYMGQYGLRRFQSSDVNEKYSFQEYHAMRIITCFMMLLAALAYCIYGMIFKNYDWIKFLVIIIVCMIKEVQAYTDVYHGCMQQQGRLDVATKCSCFRYILEIIACCVMLIITGNMLISVTVCMIVSIAVGLLTSVNGGRRYAVLKPSISWKSLKMLSIEGFPLFVSLFLNMYIPNAPKYAIDAYLTDSFQAYYNMIFMPAFVIGVIAHFIFNPILTTYAELWLAKEKAKLKKLVKLIRRQCLIILGLTVLALLVAATIGLPVLSFMFGTDLNEYKLELCVIMFGGGMLAYSTFFSTVITIIRAQYTLLVCYGVIAIAAKLFSGFFVVNYGMLGAAAVYAGLMFILTVALFVIMVWQIRKEGKTL